MSKLPLTAFLVDLEINQLSTDQLRKNAMEKNGPYAGLKPEVMRGYLRMNGRDVR